MKIDIRNDGKYLDLWSINHFLSGVVYAGWMFKWGYEGWLFFAVYFVLAIAWELYEFYADVFEELGNKVMDVVTGLIGYFLVFYFSPNLIIIEVATAVYIVLELYCYIDYQMRGKYQSPSNIAHTRL